MDEALGAVAGLKVIDLSRVLGGPYCTQILGDHGADVIKVEPPQGDETRTWGPPFQDGAAAYYLGVNRNKRGIVLDLGSPEGREAVLKLLEDADVLVENFKIGTLEKWGLGYADVLAPRFPKLIHCRISGFGADGPLGGLPGYDAAIQAAAGLMSVNGDRDPMRIGVPVIDIATGLYATIGILMALHERARSGRGQSIDATLYDSGISLLHPVLANFLLSGRNPVRTGNAHSTIVPYSSYVTKKGSIFLAIGNNGQFRKLCAILGKAELADDPRYADNAQRSGHRDALNAELATLLLNHEADTLERELLDAGVPCGAVRSVEEMANHPHTKHRNMIVESAPGQRSFGSPIKMSRSRPTYRRPPPRLNEHGDEVLGPLKGR